jgi:NADH:ubiquinone oxidoreductase subunit K
VFDIEMLFAFGLFSLGLFGVASARDFLRIFFSLEMLLNSVIMMLAITAHYLGMAQNIVLAYMVMVLATLEAALGLLIFALANKIAGITSADELEGAKDV